MNFCNYIILFGTYIKLRLVGILTKLRCGRSQERKNDTSVNDEAMEIGVTFNYYD